MDSESARAVTRSHRPQCFSHVRLGPFAARQRYTSTRYPSELPVDAFFGGDRRIRLIQSPREFLLCGSQRFLIQIVLQGHLRLLFANMGRSGLGHYQGTDGGRLAGPSCRNDTLWYKVGLVDRHQPRTSIRKWNGATRAHSHPSGQGDTLIAPLFQPLVVASDDEDACRDEDAEDKDDEISEEGQALLKQGGELVLDQGVSALEIDGVIDKSFTAELDGLRLLLVLRVDLPHRNGIGIDKLSGLSPSNILHTTIIDA